MESLAQNPSIVAALLTAIIAAVVSILALFLNQTFSRRQDRVQFLQPKLEELYLLLNEVGERNTRLFKLLHEAGPENASAKDKLADFDDLDIYGHSNAKKMVMLVRLYFPRLAPIHQCLFAAERDLNNLVWEQSTGTTPAFEDLVSSTGNVSHLIHLMESEMVANQAVLLRATVFPGRYRPTSKAEISDVPKPPESLLDA